MKKKVTNMKRMIFSLAMVLMASCVFGQTVEQLFEKYKKKSSVTYWENTDEAFKKLKQSPYMTDEDFKLQRRTFSKQEQFTFSSSRKRKMLDKDIQQIEGYELLYEKDHNKNVNEDISYYKVWFYGKVEGDMVTDTFIRFDMADKLTVIGHITCTMRKEVMLKQFLDDDFVKFSYGF